MIRSMTGYGRGDISGETAMFSVEMRSINNRFLDIQIKTPRSMGVLEPRIKKMLQELFGRGRVDVFINRMGEDGSSSGLTVDYRLAEQYVGIAKELKRRFSLPGKIDLAWLQSFPDIIGREERADEPEKLWSLLEPALRQAAERLCSMRAEEGSVLAMDMKNRLSAIESMSASVKTRMPLIMEKALVRLTDAVARIMKDIPDQSRMTQEIAILADKSDITEELIRLGSHIAQFRKLLEKPSKGSVGRKLDFLVQEMGREINTVGSKALDSDISMIVVNMKAELEKIREQAQNIE